MWKKNKYTLPDDELERMKQIGFKKPTISAEELERMKIAGMKKPQRLNRASDKHDK